MAFIVTAVIAVEAAIAVTTIATVLAAVAAVGTAITVVGLVTGNKEMVKVGGVMSLVGGIGGLAAGAMSEGAAAGAASSAGDVAAEGAGSAAADGVAADAVGGMGAPSYETAADAFGDSAITSSVAAPEVVSSTASTATYAPNTYAPDSYAPEVFGDSPTAAFQEAPMNQVSSNVGDYAQPTQADTGGMQNMQTQNTPVQNDYMSGNAPTVQNNYNTLPSPGVIDRLKSMTGWDNFSPATKDMLIKQVMAIPQGMQEQKNKDRAADQNQQVINQHSYANSMPTYAGIINRTRK